jgi:PAS domain S-box-containing protein
MTERPLHVLLVDDDRDDYLLTRDLFADIPGNRFVLDWAADYDAGLAALLRGEHDVFLLDYRLGERNGLELLREGLRRGCTAPMIILTGQSEWELDFEAMQAGAADFLIKGELNPAALERSIRYALQQKRHADELERRVAERTAELARVNENLRAEIAERRRAEEELSRNRRRLELVVTSTNLGLWYCDLPLDKLDWNAQCKAHFGLPPDADVTVDTFYARLHPDDREAVRQAIDRSLNDGAPFDMIYRAAAPDGRVRWVRAIGSVFRDAEGRPRHFDGVTLDVTEQKETEEALREADRRKDEFLAMLAHELRNPLAPIRNALHLVRMQGNGDNGMRPAWEVIERQVEQLVRLVDDLLDVSRITRGKIKLQKERVDLATVVARAVESSRPLIDARRHALQVTLPPGSLPVEADAVRLAQVLLNLLNNAAKYTPEGGRISLLVERADSQGVVRVRDTGMGIPAEMLPHIFELFTQVDRTLDRAEGGLGIGLTLVRRLTEMHGGRVEAHSEGPGQGSEFVVRLPLMQEEPPAVALTESADPVRPARPSGRRVLVVDDNRDSAESLALLLRLFGNDVRTAHDGRQGLVVAETYRPDVVLLDIGLPGLNGYEVARQLRERPKLAGVVLVALTGFGTEEDRRQARAAGFDHHMVKPVDLDALQELLVSLGAASAG